MSSHTYEESKKIALRIILLLAAITVVEVLIALVGKGYVFEGFHLPEWLMGGLMIILSLTKAVYIIFEFMHMKYEVPALAKTVLLPTALLIWAVIAFIMEGSYWDNSRSAQKDKNEEEISSLRTGHIYQMTPQELGKL